MNILKEVRIVSNLYASVVRDGKMYASLLPNSLVRSPMPKLANAEIAINLQDHKGWERLEFSEDTRENTLLTSIENTNI